MKKVSAFLSAFVFAAASPLVLAQQARHGATPLDKVKFVIDEDVRCLYSAVERGDPETGPSTMILKAPSGCLVPWHYHTASEELMVVSGSVRTEMEGASATMLGPGGYATMGSKQKHQFTCVERAECVMFVTFDGVYDIQWVKEGK